MENNKRKYEPPFKQIQLRTKLHKRVSNIAFNHEIEIRLLASACIDAVLNDEARLEEIIKALKAKK